MLREHKSIIIQKHVRGWLARVHYHRTLKAIVYLQCCYRRMMAKRELKKLKIEARSVERYKKLHIGLENKIMQLQRKIDEQVKLWENIWKSCIFFCSTVGIHCKSLLCWRMLIEKKGRQQLNWNCKTSVCISQKHWEEASAPLISVFHWKHSSCSVEGEAEMMEFSVCRLFVWF